MPETRVIDGRGMEPPEPLELAVAELATLPADGELVMLLNCEPYPLYAILESRGYRHRAERQADGSNRIHIQKA